MEAKVKLALPSTTEDGNHKHSLDLNDLIVSHPAATYYVHVESGNFAEMRISSGDILVVDRSIESYDNQIVVAILDGEFVIRKVHIEEDGSFILTNSSQDDPMRISQEMDFTIWGVVTYTIHKCIS